MALRKTLAHRLFNMTKISSGAPIFANPTTSTFNMMKSGFLRQWLQKRGIFNLAVPLECLSLPIGDQLIERLRAMNDDRLRFRAETSWIGGGRSCVEPEVRFGDLGQGREEVDEGFADGDGEVSSERGFGFEELHVVLRVRGDRVEVCWTAS
ncbi:hypothetical protein AAC387_Pa08g0772 [Persea americana]